MGGLRVRQASMEHETTQQKAKCARKSKATQGTTECSDSASVRARAQMQREAAAGMTSLADRAREWLKNASPEQLAARRQKQHDTNMAKRKKKLEGMTPSERERQGRKYENEDRRTAKKKADLELLHGIPGHEDDTLKDLPAARQAGLLQSEPPFQVPIPEAASLSSNEQKRKAEPWLEASDGEN